ncbi:unnamed protein product [Pipistrellus nathusii]|uniref:Uncharacterized protein n=1 Tax=Pipistrellus nathusii TaxID=59473 RepID=A0ABN9Z429_PIPNA
MLKGCLWLRKSAPKRKSLEQGIQSSMEKVWLQSTEWRRSWLGDHTQQGHSHRASRKTTSGRWTSWGRWAGMQRDLGLRCRCEAQITQGLCLEVPGKLFRGTGRLSSRVSTEHQGCC